MESWTSKNNKPQRSKSKLLIVVVFGFVLSAILYYMTSIWSINQEPMKDRYRRYKEVAIQEPEKNSEACFLCDLSEWYNSRRG